MRSTSLHSRLEFIWSVDKVFARKFNPVILYPNSLWCSTLFIVIMNCEPELHYCFYCISILTKFIAIDCLNLAFSMWLICYHQSQVKTLIITSCTFKHFDTNFPPIISPASWNANFPPIISLLEYKPLPNISPLPKISSFQK